MMISDGERHLYNEVIVVVTDQYEVDERSLLIL